MQMRWIATLIILMPSLFLSKGISAQTPTSTRTALKPLSNRERFDALVGVVEKAGTNPAPNAFSFAFHPAGTDVDSATVIQMAKEDGTYQTFGAIFTAYAAFGDAGSTAVPAAQSGFQTEALANIAYESEHYGFLRQSKTDADGKTHFHRPDFSFGGTVGVYPTLVMENLTATTGSIAQPNGRPMFQDAFHWNIGPKVNIPLYKHGEATAYADVGQNILVDPITSFKQGDLSLTATPVSNGVGRAAFFGEVGAQVKLFDVELIQAHLDKVSNLSPRFMIAGGFRRDNRFAKSGDLSTYNSPENRVFFRCLVSLSKILHPTETGDSAPPATFDFGVDYERPIGSTGPNVPGATRLIFGSGIDILKLFRPKAPA